MPTDTYYIVREDPETGEPRPVLLVPPLSEEELREHVLGLLAGELYSSAFVPNDMVPLVFMGVCMGGLSPSDELLVKFLGSASPPETLEGDPPKPERQDYPNYEEPPEKPLLTKPSAQKQSALEWGDIEEEEWEAHLLEVKEANQALIREWDDASNAWQGSLDSIKDERDAMDVAYDALVAEWEAVLALNAERAKERDSVREAWVEKNDRVFSRWGEDIGVLMGDMRKTFPRSINGYPLFQSFRILQPGDWARIDAACRRETARLATLEV